MAKAGKKLGKFFKKMQSFGKTNTNSSRSIASSSSGSSLDSGYGSGQNHHLCPVFVGKSRRRYLVNSDLLDHPIFRELIERSGGGPEMVVECEVVLFEHLLWMLENADDEDNTQPESLDELVDFYAY